MPLLHDIDNVQKQGGVKLSSSLIETLAVIAHSKNTTISALITSILWRYIKQYNEDHLKIVKS